MNDEAKVTAGDKEIENIRFDFPREIKNAIEEIHDDEDHEHEDHEHSHRLRM